MKNRLGFWLNQDGWPRDTEGFVFLGRAINSFGKALFSDWTGEEPVVDLLPNRSRQDTIRIFPGVVDETIICQNVSLKPAIQIDPETLPLHVKLNAEIMRTSPELGPARKRFNLVQAEIASFAEAGRLTTAWRPKIGGELHTIPAPWWNTEQLSVRFDLCQIDPDHPFELRGMMDTYCWIFVEQDSLRKSLSAISRRNQRVAGADEAELTRPKPVQTKELEGDYLNRAQTYTGKKPPSRAEDESYLKEKYGLNRTRARALRKKLAPAEWHKTGARKKIRPK